MEQPSGHGQLAAWRASFQRRYLSRLVAALRCGRIQRATSVAARSRAVKSAADLSMAMTASGRTAYWSRAIMGKYLFRPNKSHCQRGVFKSRVNSCGKRSVSAKTRPCKPNGACKNPARTGNEEAEGTVASRMQTLRALVPGSHGLDTPVFLSEAADYIVALKMQAETMHALVAHKHSKSIADSACHV